MKEVGQGGGAGGSAPAVMENKSWIDLIARTDSF